MIQKINNKTTRYLLIYVLCSNIALKRLFLISCIDFFILQSPVIPLSLHMAHIMQCRAATLPYYRGFQTPLSKQSTSQLLGMALPNVLQKPMCKRSHLPSNSTVQQVINFFTVPLTQNIYINNRQLSFSKVIYCQFRIQSCSPYQKPWMKTQWYLILHDSMATTNLLIMAWFAQ